MKKILFGFIVISLFVISGCTNENFLNSKMECEDGRTVSIGEWCDYKLDDYYYLPSCEESGGEPCLDERGKIIFPPLDVVIGPCSGCLNYPFYV